MIAPEDQARAELWGFLSRCLSGPPDAAFLEAIGGVSADPATGIGAALAELSAAARRTSPREAEREFNRIFIGLGRGELLPYASYYLTGYLHEKPLARLRADLKRMGIARAEEVRDPEDNAATLSEIMAGLIAGRFGPGGLEPQKAFFAAHMDPWMGRFFDDLAALEAPLYAPVGRLGGRFMAVEAEAFELAA